MTEHQPKWGLHHLIGIVGRSFVALSIEIFQGRQVENSSSEVKNVVKHVPFVSYQLGNDTGKLCSLTINERNASETHKIIHYTSLC